MITAKTKMPMAKTEATRTKCNQPRGLLSSVSRKSKTVENATMTNAAVQSRHTFSMIKSPLNSPLATKE